MIRSEKIELKDGNLIYFPQFFNEIDSTSFLNKLLDEIAFEQHEIKIFGKTFLTPRMESFHAKNELTYTYSGNKLISKPFNTTLNELCNKIEVETKSSFNCVLINLYRNGMDSNGWHADNEKELGKNPIIASLSFGSSRRFDLKHIHLQEKFSIQLNSGDLLWMDKNIQNFYLHQVAKTKLVHEPRINLTFRYNFFG
jgi:alkylated DNA repair dioxygenase AlkB